MSVHQNVTLTDIVYFWFGANDTGGSGDDGAAPLYDVRLAGAGAAVAPVQSGAPTLLTHVNYPDGCYEVAVDTSAGGFAVDSTYAVFCTLLVDGENPTGFVGSFTTTPVAKASVCTEVRLAELDAANLPTDIAAISLVVPPTVAQLNARTLVAADYFDPGADTVANVTNVATLTGHTAQTADHTAAIAAVNALVTALENPTTAAIAANVWAVAATIDGLTPAEALQIIAAAVAGEVSGVGVGVAPWTEVFLGLDGLTTRITATIDATYNRTAVVY